MESVHQNLNKKTQIVCECMHGSRAIFKGFVDPNDTWA